MLDDDALSGVSTAARSAPMVERCCSKTSEARAGLLGQAARCFIDHRDPERIEHSVEELVSQRVVGLALGYEDLNDHDELRHDPLLAAVVGKSGPDGAGPSART